MENLRLIWTNLAARYTSDDGLINELWQELEQLYTSKGRHYHTLHHIANMLQLAEDIRHRLQQPDAVLFAIFYHDAVYSATRTDNEEQSAELAHQRLAQIDYPETKTAKVAALILATKKHEPSTDPDTNYLIDLDLSILGAEPEHYRAYAANVRKEYAIYPDLLYKPGRRKVLQRFLGLEHIFQSEELKARYEAQARRNLQAELEAL